MPKQKQTPKVPSHPTSPQLQGHLLQEASAGAGFSASPSAHPDHLLPTCANVLHTGLYW